MRSHLLTVLFLLLAVNSAADNVLRGKNGRNLNKNGNGPPDHANGNGPPDHANNDNNNNVLEVTQHLQTPRVEDGEDNDENPNDTGIHFEKFNMYDNKEKPNMQRHGAYPMSDEVSTLLRYYSDAYSVVVKDDYEMKHHYEKTHYDVQHYIHAVGHPPVPLTEEFWEHFRTVCEVQWGRRNGNLPSDPNLWVPPDLWKDDDAYTVAERVHDEYPGENQAMLLEWFIVNLGRTGIKLDDTILPFRCVEDFIGTEVRLAALNTWAITTVAPVNFCAKWEVGYPRPEEIAWRITTGVIPEEQVPPDVYKMVIDMNLDKATSFTQYPEGCPNHPSWPAMHSAASSMSLWLAVVADLTDEQYCQVLRTDYAVSFARTVAGVHYLFDNTAGLNMGQEIIAGALPDHLAKYYGADKAAVQAKIEKYRFDWRTFSPETCRATKVQPPPTIPPTPAVVVKPGPRRGCTLKTVDFNEQPRGKYVSNEYAQYGLTLSASGGEGNSPRIFDTSIPGNEVEGDSDLGTPNKSCGGPGTGVGGQRGKAGENCTPLGNVLIVQERNNADMSIPDDNMDGGEMTLHFKGQYVKQVGLLDIDYEANLIIEFNHSSGIAVRTIYIPLLGDNSYQIVDIDVEGVRTMKLDLTRSGSISFVSFCPI